MPLTVIPASTSSPFEWTVVFPIDARFVTSTLLTATPTPMPTVPASVAFPSAFVLASVLAEVLTVSTPPVVTTGLNPLTYAVNSGAQVISSSLTLFDGESPRLLNATPAQRRNWRIAGGGYGIHWPDLDEDLSTEGLLRGAPAPKASVHAK